MASVQLSKEAYTTAVLHCAKFPAAAVVGILVGSSKGDQWSVERAIPLQHHWTQLSPMVEVGLSLINASLSSSQQQQQQQIVGLYYAPSDVTSSRKPELHPTALKIAQTISSRRGNDAVALQVNNARLGDPSDHALYAFRVAPQSTQAKHLQSSDTVQLDDKEAVTHARSAIAQGKWSQLVDFDDHLEDTSLDWLSPQAIVA